MAWYWVRSSGETARASERGAGGDHIAAADAAEHPAEDAAGREDDAGAVPRAGRDGDEAEADAPGGAAEGLAEARRQALSSGGSTLRSIVRQGASPATRRTKNARP